jgi:O-antigen ligase
MSWRVPAILALTTWGAGTFGAVYPWGLWPLLGACVVFALAAFVQPGGVTPDRSLSVALLCLAATIAVQLIPIPLSLLRRLSPETDTFLRAMDFGYDGARSHALSIRPAATIVGLAAACALSAFLLGLLRTLTRRDTANLVRGLCLVGTALALTGIAQRAMWNGKIYGFWTPPPGGNPFGPFINRNHFAGWMLMAVPLAISYFCGRVARGMRAVPPAWRERVVWFSSPDASETILVGFAVLLMALALTLTTSRSGLLGLTIALAIVGWFVVRHHTTLSRRVIAAIFLAVVLVAAVGWTGVDRLAVRFTDDVTYGNRVPIWRDTLRIASLYPLFGTGINTYGTSTLLYQQAIPTVHLAQAHNDYLQVLAEGGALVTLPAIALIIVLVRIIRGRFDEIPREGMDYWIRIGAVTGIVAMALQEIGEFSLQMPGNAVLFIVLLAIAMRPSLSARERAY